MDVGSRIKHLRSQRNISVNKLANLSGVSQSYLRDIELGNKQPTVEYLEYICFGLGISLKDFFDTDKKATEIELALEKLTAEQKKKLTEFINTI